MLLIMLLIFPLSITAQDIVVNGISVSKPGGQYDQIIVINNGTLLIEGDVICNSLVLEYGSVSVNGNFTSLDSLSLQTNPAVDMYVYGDSNTVNKATIRDNANLNILGLWNFQELNLNGGKITVLPYNTEYDRSGYATLDCHFLYISPKGHISADESGNDSRGKGGGSYKNSGGGGYGGTGGRGYWNATNSGQSFGDFFTYEIFMGGQGGTALGGGSLHIISEIAQIYGKISSNGQKGGGGGGSGGGIMLTLNQAIFNGLIEANGGEGQSGSYGGGSGGRIKIFYYSFIDFRSTTISAKGSSGFKSGEDGTIYFNSIPEIPNLIVPAENALINNTHPIFSFVVSDSSLFYDGYNESLLCKIELSLDNFSSIYRTYDQSISTSGWSNYSYKNGDIAEFSPQDLLGIKDTLELKWRVKVQGKSLFSKYSEIRNFTLIDSTVVPLTPDPYLPENSSTDIPLNPILVWNSSDFANTYQLQVSTNSNFTSLIYNQFTLSDTSIQITNLSDSTKYYWRIRAANSAGSSPYSSVWNFTTLVTRIVTISSLNPSSGVNISLSPNDNNNQGNDTTPTFTRIYNDGVTLNLTAPPIANGNNFQKWIRNNFDYSNNQNISSAIDANYTFTAVYQSPTSIKLTNDNLPTEYKLYQNYPNPFNSSAKIKFSITNSTHVLLEIFDSLGQKVHQLINRELPRGIYIAYFDATNLPSGIYYYRLVTAEYVGMKKAVLLK